jgi:hypothetical protein
MEKMDILINQSMDYQETIFTEKENKKYAADSNSVLYI